MSKFQVGINTPDGLIEQTVKGVGHFTTINDLEHHPVEVVFYGKQESKPLPTGAVGTAQSRFKVLLAVPYSNLAYYQRVGSHG